jgi:cytochrome c oxidase cbb3-type subunit I/II
MNDPGPRAGALRVEASLVRAHGLAALCTLLLSVGFGVLVAVELLVPRLGGLAPALTWGRLRYAHTQGIMLGFLGNAFLAFLYHAVPLLTGRPVTSARLGRWLFGLWNFAVMLPGWVLVLAGVSQPLEWAEFPLAVDMVVVLALALAAVQFLPPFFARGPEDLYVSSWYVIGALVFTLLAYPMGNFVPEVVPGAQGAAFSGLWIHDAVGLFVTPLALAVIYFVIPASTGRPIYSHFLSMLGFWLLFFVYPLNGTHHYVFSVIPMAAQLTAITASTILGVDVILVVTNLLLSLRGTGLVPRDVGLRFVGMSAVLYLIVSLQGSLQAQMAINQHVHFTDWVIGHSHLSMLGFAGFAAAGGLVHAWQRLPGARYNRRALDWAYWLLLGGLVVMVADLTAAGLVEAGWWEAHAPWLDSVRAAHPYWLVRALSAIPIVAGLVALLLGLTTGPRGAGLQAVERVKADEGPVIPTRANDAGDRGDPHGPARALRTAYLVASVAGVGFFAMSVSLLAIWPGRVLQRETRLMEPAHPLPLTAAERRGRETYGHEGCAYCHTQQVRYLAADVRRFGAPTLAWETHLDYPHLWGTRRIGPDLSRVGGTRTDDWHFAHLFDPRLVARDSVMPPYPALFDGTPDRPRQAARDLVAYLQSLGRARELAGPEGDAHARDACDCPDPLAQLAFMPPGPTANPAKTQRGVRAPALARIDATTRGREIYDEDCASCHGVEGAGDGPAARWLSPRPSALAEHTYTLGSVSRALWNGIDGTSMPAWRDRSTDDLSAVAAIVRRFGRSTAPDRPPMPVSDLGARVYGANCTQCHGPAGAGDGWAAAALPIAPTNFQQQQATFGIGLRAVRDGVAGTPMPPWTNRLTDEEIQAVAEYVRTLFRPDTAARQEAAR